VWFSLGENPEKAYPFGLQQLRNCLDRQTALDALHCNGRYLNTLNGDVKKLSSSELAGTGTVSSASQTESVRGASPPRIRPRTLGRPDFL
jgi:hypothetical protein